MRLLINSRLGMQLGSLGGEHGWPERQHQKDSTEQATTNVATADQGEGGTSQANNQSATEGGTSTVKRTRKRKTRQATTNVAAANQGQGGTTQPAAAQHASGVEGGNGSQI